MRETRFLAALAFASVVATAVAVEDHLADGIPEKKLISTFQIVRFPNDACVGSNSKNGTCYTSAECSDKGGASSGSCADGFGVCCTFVVDECGSSSSENITYWTQPATITRGAACTLNICPANADICQLRIDFTTFAITGPSTQSLSDHTRQGGWVPTSTTTNTNVLGSAYWKTNCQTDSLSISGKSISNSPPVLCGTNTGYHMYVDADVENCNVLQFQLGVGAASATTDSDTRGVTSTITPKWDLTVYQYVCGDINAAPPGCTQYHFGPITGRIETYNYVGDTVHLANQNQKICIRRERNYCWACFATDGIAATYQIAGVNGLTETYNQVGQPCGYQCEAANMVGGADDQCSGYDCVIVPGAFAVAPVAGTITAATTTAANIQTSPQTATLAHIPTPPQMGGYQIFGAGVPADGNALTAIVVAGGNVQNSICTQHHPFQLTFKSDDFEGTGNDAESGDSTAVQGQRGFKLYYEQIKCTA